MTLSKKYKPGTRQNFSFQNRILYKRGQCCGEIPFINVNCDNFSPQPAYPTRPICYGRINEILPPDNSLTITLGNDAPGQATGNDYELYFGSTLLQSWVNAGSTVTYTWPAFDWTVDNGNYTLVVTNNIGCTVSQPFEMIGVPRPEFTPTAVVLPSGTCVSCVDSGSRLEITIDRPAPPVVTYRYTLKGSLTNFCDYITSTNEPSLYNFDDICADRYLVSVNAYIDGEELCSWDGIYLFNP